MTVSGFPVRFEIDYLRSEFSSRPLMQSDTTRSGDDCPVCGTGMKSLIRVESTAAAILEKHYCPFCSFVHFVRAPSQEWFVDYYKSEWDAVRPRPRMLSDDPTAYTSHVALIQEYMLDKSARIFDLGAGHGVFLSQCQAHGYTHVTGIEASTRRAEHCASIGLAVSYATAETLTETPIVQERSPYDVVHCSHVLEHVGDLRRSMQQVHSILKPDGIAVFAVPNILAEHFIIVAHGVYHLRNFTPASLRHLFETNGFRIETFKVGTSLTLVARKADQVQPTLTPKNAAAEVEGFLEAFRDKLTVELAGAGKELPHLPSRFFISRPGKSVRLGRPSGFPILSRPWMLERIHGTALRERPVFGASGFQMAALNPRNILFKLYRKLFGVGRLDVAGLLRPVPADQGAPMLTLSYRGDSAPVLLK